MGYASHVSEILRAPASPVKHALESGLFSVVEDACGAKVKPGSYPRVGPAGRVAAAQAARHLVSLGYHVTGAEVMGWMVHRNRDTTTRAGA